MKNKILITGGSGFIGTNLVQYYLDKDIEVMNIDIAAPRNKDHEPFFKKIDICDKTNLIKFFHEFDPTHIVHLAARTDLDGASLDDYEANTSGTENVVEAINQSPAVVKTIFASSMLVCELGYEPVDFEDYKPTTFYGQSKVFGEKVVKRHEHVHSNWNIIRPTSIWGPWFDQPYRPFFELILKRWYINMRKGSSTKTFGFVGNTVYQIDKLLFSEEPSIARSTFYLGDRPPINIALWADEISTATGSNKEIIKVPFFVFEVAAYFGDLLDKFHIKFPMTSFRLRNMTVDNTHNVDELYLTVGEPPFARSAGIAVTLRWLKNCSGRTVN